MTLIHVERESHTSDARLIIPTVQLRNDTQVIAGANQPLITRDGQTQDVIDGRAFYAYKIHKSTTLLASGASIDIVITSSSGVTVGIGFAAQCGGNAEVAIYENVTDIVGGTVFVPLNRNRASSAISTTGALINPTSVTLGPAIYEDLILGGTTGNAAGATVRGDYALLDDVSYLFRLTNTTAQSHVAELMVQWIE